MENTEKFKIRKSAQAVVDAAVIANKNNFGIQISYQMRKRWLRLITDYPEMTASLFSYGKKTKT